MNKYEEIISLPHHESKHYPKMSLEARSAQFAPFDALEGYSESVKETERLTNKKIYLDEEKKELLNSKLNIINEQNGWGKSTFAAFIQFMFYGLEGGAKKNIREKNIR